MVLFLPAVAIWKMCGAIAYRFTKIDSEHNPVPSGIIFVVAMLTVAACIGSANPEMLQAAEPQEIWYFWPFIYCLVAGIGALLLGILIGIVGLIGFAYSSLVDAIRGE